jgi:hypothetical protein
VVGVISIFGCVQNKFRNKPYVTCPVWLTGSQTLRVAFKRLSGGVSLQVVISIISEICLQHIHNFLYPTSTRRHGNFAGVHTLLRIILSSNSAVLINIITGVSPPHFDFFVFYVLCQCYDVT